MRSLEAFEAARELASRWMLSLGETLSETNCLVFAATREGEDVVLRVPIDDEERTCGYSAQLAFSSRGGVEVLESDESTGATLMPRFAPGTMLHEAGLSPAEEVAACCSVIARLSEVEVWIGPSILVESWYAPFLRVDSAAGIPNDLLRKAQDLATQLIQTTPRPKLHHGDLHHYNLLEHAGKWVAIDPKGLIADPHLEPAAFLRNPFTTIHDGRDLMALMETRIRGFAQILGLESGRIRDWGIAQNTLSAWWDKGEARARTIRVVQAIQAASR